jgi:AcrR family transcriptional regulator
MKEKIVETSLRQFLEHGIRNMTMRKLVLTLGISTKTMYKYFSDKEELLEECLKVHYKGMDKAIIEMLRGSPNPAVSLVRVYSKSTELDFGTNHLFYHDLNHYYPDLQDKVIKHYSSGALETITGLIQQGINEGYFLDYLKAAVVLETLTVLYSSITRYNAYKKFGMKRELIKHTIMIYLRGICTDKGLQIINQMKEISI